MRQRNKAIKQVEDTSWVPSAMERLRDIAALGAKITIRAYVATSVIINAEEAEVRLRKLTALGWLHMTASRDSDGNFIEYVWELR
jgi:hypothetical protein